MKKLVGLCLIIIVAGSLMTGCNQIKKVFENANGVIIYGNEDKIETAFKEHKEGIEENDRYAYKIAEADDKTVIIFEKTTANELIEKGLLREVVKDSETEPIKELPETSNGESILFAKETVDNLEINGQTVDMSYEGNTIIGEGRTYGDMFLIVDESDWKKIGDEEKTMGVIRFDKDPKNEKFDVDAFQLVKIQS